MATDSRAVRRGLPRVPGDPPWPPVASTGPGDPPVSPVETPVLRDDPPVPAVEAPTPAVEAPAAAPALRRGLPRVTPSEPPASVGAAVVTQPEPAAEPAEQPAAAPAAAPAAEPAVVPAQPVVRKAEPRQYGPYTRAQWVGAVAVSVAVLVLLAAIVVALAQYLVSLPSVRDFLATYPGANPLPADAPVGLPAWLGWQHFLNTFFLVLIVRSGLQVRRDKRPAAFWARRGSRRRISLTLWFHQSLDILWIANGIVFVILLFTTGQWMRIVPTSWAVFPNALSATLQYLTLDWPTENGWVNYNALQQLAYFTVVFVAAPLAIITGVRMSGVWPKRAATLNRLYPVEWARRVHFPVMVFFVAFVVVHVALVLTTGALRNLNHMYAALGSTDPHAYAGNPIGFVIFVLSLVVIGAAWVAARPLVLAPIASLFGKVSR
ncbi:cytochrome b/b6 domain-containing protein [Diaminobutyricibacter sp. McL0618]|uniref:cytochrome b/b6 domain-containing protein n=1 Tax=Leifsonia sp. McL0618 TaxID=3415677 RepID=UPI003CE89E5A